jgi:hypothetical protein
LSDSISGQRGKITTVKQPQKAQKAQNLICAFRAFCGLSKRA